MSRLHGEEFHLPGRKVRVKEIHGDAWALVKEKYPTAHPEGSTAHWSFWMDRKVVAEAWPHRREGWWLRIADTPGEVR